MNTSDKPPFSPSDIVESPGTPVNSEPHFVSSPTHRAFVLEFVKTGNATLAAEAVGLAPGTAPGLLRRPEIQAAIEAEHAAALDRQRVGVDQVIAEYANVAFTNLLDLVSIQPDGTIQLNLATAPRKAWAAIREITIKGKGQHQQVTIKLHDKLRALDALAQHTGAHKQINTHLQGRNPRDLTDHELKQALQQTQKS